MCMYCSCHLEQPSPSSSQLHLLIIKTKVSTSFHECLPNSIPSSASGSPASSPCCILSWQASHDHYGFICWFSFHCKYSEIEGRHSVLLTTGPSAQAQGHSGCCCSVSKSCPTLCDPMDCRTAALQASLSSTVTERYLQVYSRRSVNTCWSRKWLVGSEGGSGTYSEGRGLRLELGSGWGRGDWHQTHPVGIVRLSLPLPPSVSSDSDPGVREPLRWPHLTQPWTLSHPPAIHTWEVHEMLASELDYNLLSHLGGEHSSTPHSEESSV